MTTPCLPAGLLCSMQRDEEMTSPARRCGSPPDPSLPLHVPPITAGVGEEGPRRTRGLRSCATNIALEESGSSCTIELCRLRMPHLCQLFRQGGCRGPSRTRKGKGTLPIRLFQCLHSSHLRTWRKRTFRNDLYELDLRHDRQPPCFPALPRVGAVRCAERDECKHRPKRSIQGFPPAQP